MTRDEPQEDAQEETEANTSERDDFDSRAEEVSEDDTDDPLSRRRILTAGGLVALLGLGARPAAADPQGQVGTASDPLSGLYTTAVNSGTGGPLVFKTAGSTALTLGVPGDTDENGETAGANVVAGYENNAVTGGAVGATISGGGSSGSRWGLGSSRLNTNEVSADYGTIGGGIQNRAGRFGTVGGGEYNTASSHATVGGGYLNTASDRGSTVSGAS